MNEPNQNPLVKLFGQSQAEQIAKDLSTIFGAKVLAAVSAKLSDDALAQYREHLMNGDGAGALGVAVDAGIDVDSIVRAASEQISNGIADAVKKELAE